MQVEGVPWAAPVRDLAEALCDLVEERWVSHPVKAFDRAAMDVVVGYARAFRSVRAIRRVVDADEAADAEVLLRTLFAVVVKSLWLTGSQDPLERERRRRSQARDYYEEHRKLANDLHDLDLEEPLDEETVQRARIANDEWFASHTDEHGKPLKPHRLNLKDTAELLELGPYYAIIYRPTSGEVHFDAGARLDHLELSPDGALLHVGLRQPKAAEADMALGKALLVWAEFIGMTEPVIGHGISDREVRLLLLEPQRVTPSAESPEP